MSRKTTDETGRNWERPDQDTQKFRHHLVTALLRSGICLTLQDGRGRYVFIINLPDSWALPDGAEPRDAEIYGAELSGRLDLAKTRVCNSGNPERVHTEQADGRYFEFFIESYPDGSDVAILTTVTELTEERRREKVLKSLLREVSHRSKNLMAIIQSIASQTARSSGSLASFLPNFYGRLHSLSRSQDLITDSSWRGASFRTLAQQQGAKYFRDVAKAMRLSGDDPTLSPNETVHVGLALHELIVNALAASRLNGGAPHIELDCTVVEKAGIETASIQWREHRTPTDLEPHGEETEDAFGSAVLNRITPSALEGTARYGDVEGVISYDLTFPLHANR
ncbi:sensor histidine kinase [Nitratireductor alexandrii]|uniref:sensor histidine kinase n=1 Tax=Nitratireductor alexandrii TaxID=2448161 RepID=UPI000FD9707B|nr:HWE histidine kinase domain-containing protein [Nitratireductor alexandrii]